MEQQDYALFELLPNKGGIFVIGGYTKDGEEIAVEDRSGKERKYEFRQGDFLKLHLAKQKKDVDHLRNHPLMGQVFREIDYAKEAKERNDKMKQVAKAMTAIVGLSQDEVVRLSLLCGNYKNDYEDSQAALFSYAQSDPDSFLKLFNKRAEAGQEILGALRLAKSKNLIREEMGFLYFGNFSLGMGEAAAVRMLEERSEVYDALKEALEPAKKAPKSVTK
jgi:hypothetical protein